MDYSKCNFVSALSFMKKQTRGPIMNVNVKSGNATLTRIVNDGMPFVRISIDENEKIVRVEMSKVDGISVRHSHNVGHMYLPKVFAKIIIDGFNSEKSKTITLEKGYDGAWYGKF